MSATTSASSASSPAASVVSASDPIVLLGRILFAVIFVLSGPRHFMSQIIAYAASHC